ncbi:hypothetical protein GCM10010170_071110 [Dactylosporangium salmoneum]|uniref:Uncharacterized protein n=1 Tax=Dactylosporangium salmoneum TaxID=53361 RepID=A0ABP5U6E6_9ACTN
MGDEIVERAVQVRQGAVDAHPGNRVLLGGAFRRGRRTGGAGPAAGISGNALGGRPRLEVRLREQRRLNRLGSI